VVIFIAGLSGSGKTVAAHSSGVVPIVPLDSFFFDEHPQLPKWLRRTDWETIGSFDLDAAVTAVASLASGASCDRGVGEAKRCAVVEVRARRRASARSADCRRGRCIIEPGRDGRRLLARESRGKAG